MKLLGIKPKINVLVAVLCVSALMFSGLALAQDSGETPQGEAGVDFINLFDLVSTLEPLYHEAYATWQEEGLRPVDGVHIELDGGAFVSYDGEVEPEVVSEFEGRTGRILLWEEEEAVATWHVEVPEDGLYILGMEYHPLPGKRASAMRDIRINGEYQFNEARRLHFERTWRDGGKPTRDNQGNDIRPTQVEAPEWRFKHVGDPEGMYRDPFFFALRKGVNEITLHATREPIAIRKIVVESLELPPTYEEVLATYRESGYQEVNDVQIKIQAEDSYRKSDPTVRAQFGTDPLVEPPSDGFYRLNEFGGWAWRKGGQTASWKFTVPESGLYKIGIKGYQSFRNLPAVREVKIDGEIPFRELMEVQFPYSRQWQMVQLGNKEGEPYLIYLEEGEHVLEMEVKVGRNAQTIRMLDTIVRELSGMGRAITYITGPNPDPYMEWEVHKRIPDLLPTLEKIRDQLRAEADALTELADNRVDVAEVFRMTAQQIQGLINDPYQLHTRIADFSEMQSRLGHYVLDLRYSGVSLDYIVVASPDSEWPRVQAGLFERLRYQALGFLESFQKDYTGVGNIYEGEDALRLWVAWGREWALVIKDMIEEEFTPRTGIHVNVNVVPRSAVDAQAASVILLASASGDAPDLAMGVDQLLPIDFAIRGGVVDISQYSDFEEVTTRFRPGMMIPYQYQGGYYALPETQSFNMMFYRTDIIEQELGLKPPQTWDDVREMLPELQQRGMDFFYPSPAGANVERAAISLGPFLYQHGGDFYTEDGLRSALESPEALTAFREWTDLFANYRIPLEANFYNRMRTGEMPIGIADYFTYVLLSTAAPELTGWWKMVPIPGVRQPDGTIDRSAGGTSTAVVIFRDSKYPEAAWELMKWWTSTEVQTRYAEEIEALIGIEAKWNTANVEAFNNLPWPKGDLQAILDQWEWFREKPVVLGDYFTPRHVVNAWNAVVLEGQNPREALEKAVQDINRELIRKQEEFGVEIDEEYKRQLYRGVVRSSPISSSDGEE